MSCVSARWRSWLSTRHMSCVSTMIVVRRSPAARSVTRSLGRSLARSLAGLIWSEVASKVGGGRGFHFGRDTVSSDETMYIRERQCVLQRKDVSSGETMCLPETQCVFGRDNVSSSETMCFPERQCVFQRDNVSSGDTMWLPETGCPGHKLTSRSSPDLFPASIRIKMMRETRW